jgi:hypothetical protein
MISLTHINYYLVPQGTCAANETGSPVVRGRLKFRKKNLRSTVEKAGRKAKV